MRIAVMGSGGLGGYFGARLCDGGSEVHFIARGKHLEAELDPVDLVMAQSRHC